MIGMRVCLLVASVLGNLTGTLPKDSMKVFIERLEQAAKSVQDLYYIQQINAHHRGVDPEKTCPSIVQEGERDLDLLFYTFQTTKGLSSFVKNPICDYKTTDADEDKIQAAIENPKNVKELVMGVGIELIRGNGVNGQTIIPTFVKLLKEDDSVLASSMAIVTAVRLWKLKPNLDLSELTAVVDIQDLFAQADSFDKQLSFDGDIVTTSYFIQACLALADYNEKFPLTAEQVVGFGNFVANGYRPTTTSEIYYFIRLVSDLNNNKYAQPIHVQLISKRPFHHPKQVFVVALLSLDGEMIDNAKVSARSITHSGDNEVLLTNAPLRVHNPKKDEAKEKHFGTETFYDAVYEVKIMQEKPKPGFYDVELEISGRKELALSEDAVRFKIKVTGRASIENVKVTLGSKDKSEKAQTFEGIIDADKSVGRQGKVTVEFTVQDEEKKSIKAHQAFVRVLSKVNYQSVTFVAEQKDGKYSASFDVSEHCEGGLNGLSIYVGDALIFPGVMEHNAGEFTVNGIPEPESGVYSTKYLKKYAPLPAIQHTFREPEPRPPVVISLAFTAICAVPLLGLLIAWQRLGVNLNRMEGAFLPFHIAIASVFGLYFMYWLKFNMFTTLKYLAVLGSATFILGNRVLSKLASAEK